MSNISNFTIQPYALVNGHEGNFTINTADEALDLGAVRQALGVHARIPGAFYAPVDGEWADETGATEAFLFGDEPVAIPAEIALHTSEDGVTRTSVKAWRVGTAREVSLPSLSTQWRADWARRVEILKARGLATSESLVLKAPQQFIETGVWPADVARP